MDGRRAWDMLPPTHEWKSCVKKIKHRYLSLSSAKGALNKWMWHGHNGNNAIHMRSDTLAHISLQMIDEIADMKGSSANETILSARYNLSSTRYK